MNAAIELRGLRESTIDQAFNLVQLPKTFLVKEGEIIAMDPSEKQLERLLKQYLLTD